MARRRDNLAAIYAYHLHELQMNVVAPALERLQPIPREQLGGPRKFRVQVARDNGHNALCYEARLSFAMTIGAIFERYLRLWLSQASPWRRPQIERAERTTLAAVLAELKGPSLAGLMEGGDLKELWELVSTARHGDGPAAMRLQAINPNLWSQNGELLQAAYDRGGLRAYTMRVEDSDLSRYFAAVIGFWTIAAGR